MGNQYKEKIMIISLQISMIYLKKKANYLKKKKKEKRWHSLNCSSQVCSLTLKFGLLNQIENGENILNG